MIALSLYVYTLQKCASKVSHQPWGCDWEYRGDWGCSHTNTSFFPDCFTQNRFSLCLSITNLFNGSDRVRPCLSAPCLSEVALQFYKTSIQDNKGCVQFSALQGKTQQKIKQKYTYFSQVLCSHSKMSQCLKSMQLGWKISL